MVRWSEDDKFKALAIAESSSMSEAEKKTGIPKGTIGRWASGLKKRNETDETKRNAKKIRDISDQAIEEAKVEVREYVASRVKLVSDGLLELVDLLAKTEAANLIRSGQDPDDSKAQWLRSVVGAIAQGVEKHQLLEGKPTSRQAVDAEVKTIHEEHYHITQELIEGRPELADELIRRRMVDRGIHTRRKNGVQWINPRLCCRVHYLERTERHHLKTVTFKGFQFNKDPKECRWVSRSVALSFVR